MRRGRGSPALHGERWRPHVAGRLAVPWQVDHRAHEPGLLRHGRSVAIPAGASKTLEPRSLRRHAATTIAGCAEGRLIGAAIRGAVRGARAGLRHLLLVLRDELPIDGVPAP